MDLELKPVKRRYRKKSNPDHLVINLEKFFPTPREKAPKSKVSAFRWIDVASNLTDDDFRMFCRMENKERFDFERRNFKSHMIWSDFVHRVFPLDSPYRQPDGPDAFRRFWTGQKKKCEELLETIVASGDRRSFVPLDTAKFKFKTGAVFWTICDELLSLSISFLHFDINNTHQEEAYNSLFQLVQLHPDVEEVAGEDLEAVVKRRKAWRKILNEYNKPSTGRYTALSLLYRRWGELKRMSGAEVLKYMREMDQMSAPGSQDTDLPQPTQPHPLYANIVRSGVMSARSSPTPSTSAGPSHQFDPLIGERRSTSRSPPTERPVSPVSGSSSSSPSPEFSPLTSPLASASLSTRRFPKILNEPLEKWAHTWWIDIAPYYYEEPKLQTDDIEVVENHAPVYNVSDSEEEEEEQKAVGIEEEEEESEEEQQEREDQPLNGVVPHVKNTVDIAPPIEDDSDDYMDDLIIIPNDNTTIDNNTTQTDNIKVKDTTQNDNIIPVKNTTTKENTPHEKNTTRKDNTIQKDNTVQKDKTAQKDNTAMEQDAAGDSDFSESDDEALVFKKPVQQEKSEADKSDTVSQNIEEMIRLFCRHECKVVLQRLDEEVDRILHELWADENCSQEDNEGSIQDEDTHDSSDDEPIINCLKKIRKIQEVNQESERTEPPPVIAEPQPENPRLPLEQPENPQLALEQPEISPAVIEQPAIPGPVIPQPKIPQPEPEPVIPIAAPAIPIAAPAEAPQVVQKAPVETAMEVPQPSESNVLSPAALASEDDEWKEVQEFLPLSTTLRLKCFTNNLTKNPDFNSHLKCLSLEFLRRTKNRHLLKSCRKLTVDVARDLNLERLVHYLKRNAIRPNKVALSYSKYREAVLSIRVVKQAVKTEVKEEFVENNMDAAASAATATVTETATASGSGLSSTMDGLKLKVFRDKGCSSGDSGFSEAPIEGIFCTNRVDYGPVKRKMGPRSWIAKHVKPKCLKPIRAPWIDKTHQPINRTQVIKLLKGLQKPQPDEALIPHVTPPIENGDASTVYNPITIVQIPTYYANQPPLLVINPLPIESEEKPENSKPKRKRKPRPKKPPQTDFRTESDSQYEFPVDTSQINWQAYRQDHPYTKMYAAGKKRTARTKSPDSSDEDCKPPVPQPVYDGLTGYSETSLLTTAEYFKNAMFSSDSEMTY